MKKILSSIFALALVATSVFVPNEVQAKKAEDDDGGKVSVVWGAKNLSKKQMDALKDKVGLTEKEIEDFPEQVLLELIKNNAKKIKSGPKKKVEIQSPKSTSKKGGIRAKSVSEDLDRATLKLNGVAFEVDSDKSGKHKFYFYGLYEWLDSPGFELEDALSLGWPNSAEIVLPMSSGKVQQHQTQYCDKPDNNASVSWDCNNDSSPEDWDNGMGVGNRFDIDGSPSNNIHKGFIGQYVYTARSSGYVNVKFEYGHQMFDIGSPEFGVWPAGLSVQPDSVDEIIDYGLEFEW